MTETRNRELKRCPDCETTIGRDALIGRWLCDDCALAIDDSGNRIA